MAKEIVTFTVSIEVDTEEENSGASWYEMFLSELEYQMAEKGYAIHDTYYDVEEN